MGRNWEQQPRDKRGRWRSDQRRDIRLDLRLSNAVADTLLTLENETGRTKTDLIEAALTAYRGDLPGKAPRLPPPPPAGPGLEALAAHRAALVRRKRRRG